MFFVGCYMENIDEMALDELYYIVLLCNKYGEKETPYDMDMVWNNISNYYYLENNMFICHFFIYF